MCNVWEVCPLLRPLLKLAREKYQICTVHLCLCLRSIVKRDPCPLNEKQGKENLDYKRLSDDTKIEFGATKDHG